MGIRRRTIIWILWVLLTLVMVAYFAAPLITRQNQQVFLMGQTSHGHHQIEMACGSCHTDPFGGKDVIQSACINCHGEELKAVSDSHPKAKFTNPRNVDRVKALDARYCATCHMEHRPDKTLAMGVTLPTDLCFSCHQEIAKDRPSHQGMTFDSCASAGCHNFHDNLALYEDFLLEHANEPMFKDVAKVLEKNASRFYEGEKTTPLSLADQDGGEHGDSDISAQWQHSAHAAAGVNCSGCHNNDTNQNHTGVNDTWVERPGIAVCEDCHQQESETFLLGKHGMRIAAGLSPMQVSDAKIPMHEDAAHLDLTCNSCHSAHEYDVQKAATEACAGCHGSEHVVNFKNSKHAAIALQSNVSAQEIVTCATCHMPRVAKSGAGSRVLVNHNQNANLRPNEKMIRSVCMSCHSLEFSIDSLADPALIQSNFTGRPSQHIQSIDMAVERDQARSGRSSVYN